MATLTRRKVQRSGHPDRSPFELVAGWAQAKGCVAVVGSAKAGAPSDIYHCSAPTRPLARLTPAAETKELGEYIHVREQSGNATNAQCYHQAAVLWWLRQMKNQFQAGQGGLIFCAISFARPASKPSPVFAEQAST